MPTILYSCADLDTCGIVEQILKDRSIKWPKDSMKREGLVTSLEKADERATVEKSLDLPPELREHVAMLCAAWLVSPLYNTDSAGKGI